MLQKRSCNIKIGSSRHLGWIVHYGKIFIPLTESSVFATEDLGASSASDMNASKFFYKEWLGERAHLTGLICEEVDICAIQ